MDLKLRAAEAAVMFVRSGMVLGLGSGSTAERFIELLGTRLARGELTGLRGVPTSERSAELAARYGIPLCELPATGVDLAVDGADEVAPGLKLIKGLGGALVREKIVAQMATRFIVIVDGSKVVPRLGVRSPLPVEVVPFGHAGHVAYFRSLGAEPSLRYRGGDVWVTDNGNVIYDLRFPDGITDPESLEMTLLTRAGVVDTGLFLRHAHTALIATEAGVEVRPRDV